MILNSRLDKATIQQITDAADAPSCLELSEHANPLPQISPIYRSHVRQKPCCGEPCGAWRMRLCECDQACKGPLHQPPRWKGWQPLIPDKLSPLAQAWLDWCCGIRSSQMKAPRRHTHTARKLAWLLEDAHQYASLPRVLSPACPGADLGYKRHDASGSARVSRAEASFTEQAAMEQKIRSDCCSATASATAATASATAATLPHLCHACCHDTGRGGVVPGAQAL